MIEMATTIMRELPDELVIFFRVPREILENTIFPLDVKVRISFGVLKAVAPTEAGQQGFNEPDLREVLTSATDQCPYQDPIWPFTVTIKEKNLNMFACLFKGVRPHGSEVHILCSYEMSRFAGRQFNFRSETDLMMEYLSSLN